jgi:uncharacterized protein YggU (UPF0235/DUF167 family)
VHQNARRGRGRAAIEMSGNGNSVWFRVRVQPRANDSLRGPVAESLNVPVSAVRIVSGENSRNKRVATAGVTSAQVRELGSPSASTSKKDRD